MTIDNQIPTELMVFDFDETIVNCNSDTFINVLAPEGNIPQNIWNDFQSDNDWTAYMQQVFAYLAAAGVREKDYKQCLAKMPFVDALKQLLMNLAKGCSNKRFEVIIISDANTFFINYTLKHHKLDHVFRKVFTNPAKFDEAGHLKMERYHEQNWCQLSARNLCKGHVLKEYIRKRGAEGVTFARVNYAGDGSNDLCPSMKLSSRDRVFARAGYPLHKLCAAKLETKELHATMYPFKSGDDIWKVLSATDD